MKYFLILITTIICQSSFAQQMSYKQWKEEAKSDIRLLPEYGHAQKTEGQIEADQELIKTELKQNGTRRRASDTLISLGFDYL
ncbi:MAG TPA: hypothetical protein VFE54_01085, partial [Mucilaginibacter sp.]|nr:hypothetical protein [Mucilaginibacter sp.]